MASEAIAVNKDQLAEIVRSITLQHISQWWEDARNGGRHKGISSHCKMSYEEFLEWADEDTLAEWVNGEVQMSSPASLQHQDIGDFLAYLLRSFIEYHTSGIVVSSPFQMKLENGREPDLLFVARNHIDRIQNTYLDGPADLAVEIVSPESVNRDRGEKFVEYESGKIPEYWLIDPLRQQVECYQLDEKGQYHTAFSGGAGTYRAVVLPGFWMKVDWFWQQPLPDAARTAWEIIGIDGLRELLAELERETAQEP